MANEGSQWFLKPFDLSNSVFSKGDINKSPTVFNFSLDKDLNPSLKEEGDRELLCCPLVKNQKFDGDNVEVKLKIVWSYDTYLVGIAENFFDITTGFYIKENGEAQKEKASELREKFDGVVVIDPSGWKNMEAFQEVLKETQAFGLDVYFPFSTEENEKEYTKEQLYSFVENSLEDEEYEGEDEDTGLLGEFHSLKEFSENPDCGHLEKEHCKFLSKSERKKVRGLSIVHQIVSTNLSSLFPSGSNSSGSNYGSRRSKTQGDIALERHSFLCKVLGKEESIPYEEAAKEFSDLEEETKNYFLILLGITPPSTSLPSTITLNGKSKNSEEKEDYVNTLLTKLETFADENTIKEYFGVFPEELKGKISGSWAEKFLILIDKVHGKEGDGSKVLSFGYRDYISEDYDNFLDFSETDLLNLTESVDKDLIGKE